MTEVCQAVVATGNRWSAAATWSLPLVVALVILIVGCTKRGSISTAAVSGKVTYKGQPVEGATVSFVPEGETRPATALTAKDGSYRPMTLDSSGAMPGKYTVTVRKQEIAAASTQAVSMEEALKLNNRPPPAPKELLPTKYGDAARSPLHVEVKEGHSNVIDLTLAD